MMSRRLAPSALRSPISRVRSLTTISMMFMITMPPTTSDSPTMPTRTTAMPAVACWKMPSTESEASMPKLSGSGRLQAALDPQRHARFVLGLLDERRVARPHHQLQRLARAEELLETHRAGSPRTRPASCRRPSPSSPTRPRSRKLTPAIRTCLSSGSAAPNRRSATCQPSSGDVPLAADLDRADHPAPFGVEGGEVEVFLGHALHLNRFELLVAVCHPCALLRLGHHRADRDGEASDRRRIVERDDRVAPLALELVLVLADARALDHERVGARGPTRWRRSPPR